CVLRRLPCCDRHPDDARAPAWTCDAGDDAPRRGRCDANGRVGHAGTSSLAPCAEGARSRSPVHRPAPAATATVRVDQAARSPETAAPDLPRTAASTMT